MENIENRKKRYIDLFASKYYGKSKDELTESEERVCLSIAEMWAYIDSVVPEEHSKYSIFDFDGCVANKTNNEKEEVISSSLVLSAKNKICMYCWGVLWEEIKKQEAKDPENIRSFLREKSVMIDRSENGNNIVIFGASQKPIGRTMLASVVMKEAIKLRTTQNQRGQTYDWVDFSVLVRAIKEDSLDLSDYRSCDWLVVDNILPQTRTQAGKTYIIDTIDPFFIGRYDDKLPTILVFKFDIRNSSLLMEKTFGVGISRIIKSKRTTRIPLSEEFLA